MDLGARVLEAAQVVVGLCPHCGAIAHFLYEFRYVAADVYEDSGV